MLCLPPISHWWKDNGEGKQNNHEAHVFRTTRNNPVSIENLGVYKTSKCVPGYETCKTMSVFPISIHAI